MSTLTIAQRLERLPITSYQRTIFAVIASAWFFDCLDVAMMTFVLSSIVTDFSLTTAQAGTLGSMSFIGMFIGAGSAGILADKYGRVVVFRASIIIWGLASLACAFAPNVEALMFFRVLLGVGLAMELPVGQSMICEFVPARVRGKYVALLEGMWPVGFIAAGLLAMTIVPTFGWRGAFIAEAIPAIFVLVIRRMVPESPRWLSDSGQAVKANEVITGIETKVQEALKKSGKSETLTVASMASEEIEYHLHTAVATMERDEEEARGKHGSHSSHGGDSHSQATSPVPFSKKNSIAVIFEEQYRKRTAMIWMLWFFALLGYYGLTTWFGFLQEAKGMNFAKSTENIVFMSVAGIPGFFTAAWLVEAWGRKPMMILTLVCSAVSAYFYGTADSINMMLGFGLVMQFFMFGMWSVIYAYTPELYPTFARATGSGFASSIGRLGALLGPLLVGVILPASGQQGVFAMGAGAFVLAAAAVLVLGEETKGKVLEEI
jgi:putative MFS transporter